MTLSIPPSIMERAGRLLDSNPQVRDPRTLVALAYLDAAVLPKGITEEHRALLRFYRVFEGEHGHTPSYSEAGEGMGISKTKIFNLLHQLEERGVVIIHRQRARSVSIIHDSNVSSVSKNSVEA